MTIRQAKACLWLILLILFNNTPVSAQDTLSIYFQLNKHQLTPYNTHKIDSLLYYNAIKSNQKIMIVGYTDYIGTDDYNNELSKQRANSVGNYLSSMSIDTNMIVMCVGKGEIKRDIPLPKGYASDRRVDLILNYTQPTSTPNQSSIPIRSYDIAKVPIGKTFILRNIHFIAERHFMTDASKPELGHLYQTLVDNPTLKIRIEGHVCCIVGAPDALDIDTKEFALSLNRAKYIYDYLVDQGIDSTRLEYLGLGRKRPLIPVERSEKDRAMNRRVEVRIMSR